MPVIQKVQKVVEVPRIEIEEQIVEVLVQKHVRVPMIQKVQTNVEAGFVFWHLNVSRDKGLR